MLVVLTEGTPETSFPEQPRLFTPMLSVGFTEGAYVLRNLWQDEAALIAAAKHPAG